MIMMFMWILCWLSKSFFIYDHSYMFHLFPLTKINVVHGQRFYYIGLELLYVQLPSIYFVSIRMNNHEDQLMIERKYLL